MRPKTYIKYSKLQNRYCVVVNHEGTQFLWCSRTNYFKAKADYVDLNNRLKQKDQRLMSLLSELHIFMPYAEGNKDWIRFFGGPAIG